jgi:hypothetical protein
MDGYELVWEVAMHLSCLNFAYYSSSQYLFVCFSAGVFRRMLIGFLYDFTNIPCNAID